MVRKILSVSLAVILAALNISPAFAQPDLKFPWNAGVGYQFGGGPHVRGVVGFCEQVLVSNLVALDFSLPGGTEVLASGSGIVSQVGEEAIGGKFVIVDHGDGWYTRYYHLSQILVTQGQRVSQGTLIAKSGNSGTGAGGIYHLHFEVRPTVDNVVVDGYKVHPATVAGDYSRALNYVGTLTKGSETAAVVYGYCNGNNAVKVSGSGTNGTVEALSGQFVTSTNQKVATSTPIPSACSGWAVGAGSSRQQLFIDAYNRNGGLAILGCPYDATYWWQGGSGWFVRQDLANSLSGANFTIAHNEGADNPPGTIPAFVLPPWSRDFYLNYGGLPLIGMPTSDTFINSFGHEQQNFSSGFLWRDVPRGQTHPVFDDGNWYWLDQGGNYNLAASLVPADGGGVQLVLDGKGGSDQWVQSAWVRKSVSNLAVNPDLRVVWEQFDRAHLLFFQLIIRGSDGVNHSLTYSHDADYWAWNRFSGNIFADFKSLYRIDPTSIEEIRVGHYLNNSWIGDKGGVVQNIIFDYLPPETSITLPEPDGNDGWYKASPLVTLTATDDVSGIDRIEYDFGFGWQVYSGPFQIPQNGEVTLQYRAIDQAGHVEQPRSRLFKIDNAPPQTQISNSVPSFESEDGKVYVSGQTRFSLSAVDETSGVAMTNFDSAGGEPAQNYQETFGLGGQDGKHVVSFHSTDHAGNVEATKSREVYLDSTAPLSSDNSDGQWHNKDVIVAIVSKDPPAPDGTPGSGVKEIDYSGAQEGKVSGATAQLVFTNEGTYELIYYSIDNVENVEEVKQAPLIKIDKTPPVISGAPVTSPNKNGWYNQDVVVHFGATDNLSGVKSFTSDTLFTSEGFDQKVIGAAQDNAGNLAEVTVDGINIDKTKPESTLALLPSYVNQLPFEISYNASDNLSGLDRIRLYKNYQGSKWEFHSYDDSKGELNSLGSFNVKTLKVNGESREGRWGFTSCAVDQAGNKECDLKTVGNLEKERQRSTIYDITAPTSKITSVAEGNYYNQWPGIFGTANDVNPESPAIETSGVEKVEVQVDKDSRTDDWKVADGTGDWSLTTDPQDGSYTVYSRATDRAGNQESIAKASFVYDTTPPTTSLILSGARGSSDWYVSPALVSLTAIDATSGISQTSYRLGDSEGSNYTRQLSFADGVYPLEFWSVDRAGNEEKHQFLKFKIDTTAPPAPISSVLGGTFLEDERVEVALTSEAGAQIYYVLNNASPILYSESFPMDKSLILSAYAIDEAGNKSEIASWNFTFRPRLKPIISPSASSSPNESSPPQVLGLGQSTQGGTIIASSPVVNELSGSIQAPEASAKGIESSLPVVSVVVTFLVGILERLSQLFSQLWRIFF